MLLDQDSRVRGQGAPAVVPGGGAASDLERQCATYTRYLAGRAPTRYMVEKYLDFHQKFGRPMEIDRFDAILVSLSARTPRWARLADSYASVLRKNSAVRKKLVLTLALLECAPPTCEELDRVPRGGPAAAVVRLGLSAAIYACALLIAVALLTPVRLWTVTGKS